MRCVQVQRCSLVPPSRSIFRPFSVVAAWYAACVLAACTGTVGQPSGPSSAAGSDSEAGSGVPGASSGALGCEVPTLGATPLARLTRTQYAESVKALLGVDADVSQLAEDEKIGAFAGNAAAPVSELLVEQYAQVAESVAASAKSRLASLVDCEVASAGAAACASRFITEVGQRVYRRPLDAAELDAYRALYDSFGATDHSDGLRVVAQTMLQSPSFLYHVELTPGDARGKVAPLDAFELASRLSFFLVGATPDDTLLAAAADGSLLDDTTLAAQAERLLDDPRSDRVLEDFHLQWLGLDQLASLSKSTSAFPAFDDRYAPAMEAETRAFVRYVLREDDARLDTLLTAPYSFPSGPLLDLYGVSAADDGGPVPLDPTQRAGLLTQPAFLAVHAHASQSSPVQRGKVVIRNVLCQSLPDPPPNVVAQAPDPRPDATTREQITAHQADPACAGCHVRIDGVGFGFEAFDALGAFRTHESGQPVDAQGTLLGTPDSDGAFDGAVELAHRLAESEAVASCVTRQWFRFALGRFEADDDACALDALTRGFEASSRNVRSLLGAIVASPAFRAKRVPASQP
jgi:Protein of unknown function (DUF1592)/Protein of unknown function (DUF1588)/Protein of unknown function (DUF1585)/Protein of unknown function (DUF1595)/Protein of unknown function (DUF1587)